MSTETKLFGICAEGRHEQCHGEFRDTGNGSGLRCSCECHLEVVK